MATYGEGDPTDNSKEFYEWIQKKDLPENILNKVKFTVFGLGNT
jgi:NADPH-ferrihemoprotein reductase